MMASIYIPYGTTEGQTARIAEFIGDVVQAHGHEARVADIKQAGDAIPPGCDAVLVGASVHMGKHEEYVQDFVRKTATPWNASRLPCSPSALPRTEMPKTPKATSRSSSSKPAGGRPTWHCSAAHCSTRTTGSSSGSS